MDLVLGSTLNCLPLERYLAGGGVVAGSHDRCCALCLCSLFIAELTVAAVGANSSYLIVILRADNCGGIFICRACDSGDLVKIGVAAGCAVDLIAGRTLDGIPREDYAVAGADGKGWCFACGKGVSAFGADIVLIVSVVCQRTVSVAAFGADCFLLAGGSAAGMSLLFADIIPCLAYDDALALELWFDVGKGLAAALAAEPVMLIIAAMVNVLDVDILEDVINIYRATVCDDITYYLGIVQIPEYIL